MGQALYKFLVEPETVAAVAPLLLPCAGRFTVVAGHSFFGDLFLRDPTTGEYAILIGSTLELAETGEIDEAGLRAQVLAAPEVERTLLRPDDVAALVRALGALARDDVFFPVPLPAIGGSGDLASYQRGGMWEYLAIAARMVGVSAERRARTGPGRR